MQKSISKLIFAGYTGSKNPIWNRLKIQFVELDFSKLFFQKSSTDQQGDWPMTKNSGNGNEVCRSFGAMVVKAKEIGHEEPCYNTKISFFSFNWAGPLAWELGTLPLDHLGNCCHLQDIMPLLCGE